MDDDLYKFFELFLKACFYFLGDSVTLVSPSGSTTVIGTVPRLKSYRIAALFEVGMYEYDSSFIYMPLEGAQVFFRSAGRSTRRPASSTAATTGNNPTRAFSTPSRSSAT